MQFCKTVYKPIEATKKAKEGRLCLRIGLKIRISDSKPIIIESTIAKGIDITNGK